MMAGASVGKDSKSCIRMKFGIFDHLDRNDLPLDEFYEQRLQLVEAYDRGGFYSYHTAEHHATPLGLAA